MKQIYCDAKALFESGLADIGSRALGSIVENQSRLIQSRNEKSVYCIYDQEGENQLILKIWRYHDLKHRFKDMLKIGNPYSEFRGLRLLNHASIPCPKIYFFGKSITNSTICTYYQITEFIDSEEDAMQYVKRLLHKNLSEELEGLSREILVLTQSMLDIHLIDTDHRMTNLMVNKQGQPMKIDLELSNTPSRFRKSDKQVGMMIATLVYSYALAVQPNVNLAQKFSDRAFNSLNLTAGAKLTATTRIRRALLKQFQKTGIETEIKFNQIA